MANPIDDLKNNDGWVVYERALQSEFDRQYKKLRSYAKKNDEEHFLKIAGRLDGLEYAMKLPDILKARG